MRVAAREDSKKHGRILHLSVPGLQNVTAAETPLRFVESAGRVQVLAPTDPLPQWARALLAARTALWRIGRKEFTGRVTPVSRFDASGVITKFEKEFGSDQVHRWFGTSFRAFELEPLTPEAATYRESVESYFDEIASSYDSRVASNPLDSELRRTSVEKLVRLFHPGERVLELGCGTGLETLRLGERGIRIVATDISGEMISLLKRKIDTERLERFVEAKQLAAGDISLLVDEYGRGSFDGAFSTFGALNCEESLAAIPSGLAALVRPNGAVMFGIWNRSCAAEFSLSLAGGNFHRAFARHRSPVPLGSSRYGIPVHAHSFGSFVRPFLPYFQVERVAGVSVFVPPYDYDRMFTTSQGLLRLLHRLDERFASRFPFNRFGDHFFVEMKRRR